MNLRRVRMRLVLLLSKIFKKLNQKRALVLYVENKSKWIIGSDGSHHMTWDKDKFV